MKKGITTFGILFAFFITLGAVLKFNHWPGGEYSILIGLGISGMVLSILLLAHLFRKTRNYLFLFGIPVALFLILTIINMNGYFINGIFWFRTAWVLAVIYLLAVLVYSGYIRKDLSFVMRVLLMVSVGLLSLIHILMFQNPGMYDHITNLENIRKLEKTTEYLAKHNELLLVQLQDDPIAHELKDSTRSILATIDDFMLKYRKHFQSRDSRIFNHYLSSTWAGIEARSFLSSHGLVEFFRFQANRYLNYLDGFENKEAKSIVETIRKKYVFENGSVAEWVILINFCPPAKTLVNIELLKVQILLAEHAILQDMINLQNFPETPAE